jgi:peptidoglycan L-alanyl-D-glutamate endopeptidase CwlK
VDLAVLLGGEVRWDWPLYRILWASGVYPAAQEIGVLVEWGGNWESFPDGGHFQLPWIAYPPVKEEPRNA